jgi:hypothetical protein
VHSAGIQSSCFSPDGTTLCLASEDKTASLLDLRWSGAFTKEHEVSNWINASVAHDIVWATRCEPTQFAHSVRTLAPKFPDIILYGGSGLLRHALETNNASACAALVAAILDAKTKAVPLRTAINGRSVIEVALKMQPPDPILVQNLFAGMRWEALTSAFTVVPNLAQDLARVAELLPADLVDIIETLEKPLEQNSPQCRVFQYLRTIETLTQRLEDFDVRGCNDLRAGNLPWSKHEGDSETEASVSCRATLQLLALQGFAAAPNPDQQRKFCALDQEDQEDQEEMLPPFTRVFNAAIEANLPNSDFARLMRSKLYRTVTSFKWNAYAKRRVKMRLIKYAAHLVLAAATMAVSAQSDVGPNDSIANVLQGLLLASNTLFVLRDEICQVLYVCNGDALTEKLSNYMSDVWNWFDIIGMLALYLATVAHFTNMPFVLQPIGGLGVLLNAFSFLQLLKPFDSTGPLIKIIEEILKDIVPFMVVLMILLLGFSNAFAVSMPTSVDYSFNLQGVGGPLSGMLTAFLSMLGDFDLGSQYKKPVAVLMFLVFLFLMVIVMMNLLIAIMSDSYERVSSPCQLSHNYNTMVRSFDSLYRCTSNVAATGDGRQRGGVSQGARAADY